MPRYPIQTHGNWFSWSVSVLSLAAGALACSSDGEATPAPDPAPVDTASNEAIGGAGGMGEQTPMPGGAPGELPNDDIIQETPMVEEEPADCESVEVDVTPVPVVLQLLVDTSASMTQNVQNMLPEPGEQNKWEITRDALNTALGNLRDQVSVGTIYFPDVEPPGLDPCFGRRVAVPVGALGPAGSTQRTSLVEANNTIMTGGGTPTHDSVLFAVEQLQSAPADATKFLALITDGAPSTGLGCNLIVDFAALNPPLIEEVRKAKADHDITTFVVGSPGSEIAREALSQMAEEGGTAKTGCSNAGPNYCHFDMTTSPDFSVALTEALAVIGDATLPCSYEVPANPGGGTQLDKESASVNLIRGDGTRLSVDRTVEGAGCTTGWDFNADETLVTLCSSTCESFRDEIRQDPAAKVSVGFKCRPDVSIK